MGGQSKVIKGDPVDAFDTNPMMEAMVAKPTREIMFAVLTKDRESALAPSDLRDQCDSLRVLARDIEFEVSQWQKPEPYHRLLVRVERLIHEANIRSNSIRLRAHGAARERKAQAKEDRLRKIPKWGVERFSSVDSAAPSNGSSHIESQTENETKLPAAKPLP